MNIDYPSQNQIDDLRALWREAFGDDDAFLDMFYASAYAPHRCRCMLDGDRVAAVLYWFDCTCDGQKLAYVYAVATDPVYRNQGICRRLMADTHPHLKEQGYAGAMLLPQDPGLRQMYGKMGYLPCTNIGERIFQPAEKPATLTELTADDYARLRKTMLPPGSVIQEQENLSYLANLSRFYRIEDTIAALFLDGNRVICYELLGDITKAPEIIRTFGALDGLFRFPGTEKAFTMYLPLVENCPKPRYFAFAFD